uniref:Uncharacterized protein n=1 Tax=Octopus bimaculoides TaxID=37653 RepID=A0A0L8FW64_OCTBM
MYYLYSFIIITGVYYTEQLVFITPLYYILCITLERVQFLRYSRIEQLVHITLVSHNICI